FRGRAGARLASSESRLDQLPYYLLGDAAEFIRQGCGFAVRGCFSSLRSFARFGSRLEAFELRLDLAAFLFLALDVDAPAGELGRQAHVLALLADGQRQLLVFDNHLHYTLAIVDDRHALDLGGGQRIGDKCNRILRPLDDVDFFAAQFADDRLHPSTLHADAGAHRVDVAFA